MRCKEFDAQIDELLSGVLHPDASEHLRHCERCNSHFRARSAVHHGLRVLASAAAQGPSRATDLAVLESYRRLQQRRAADAASVPQKSGKVVAFPGRRPAAHGSRKHWGGMAVAAALLAMVGSGLHLWRGAGMVTAPSMANVPVASRPLVEQAGVVSNLSAAAATATNTLASASLAHHASLRELRTRLSAGRAAHSAAPVLAAKAVLGVSAANAAVAENAPKMQQPDASSIMHLASTGAASDVARSASSTWPGYSNLMYCDPMVCSGPMQVIHIRVPANQINPSAGQSGGNSFVNADVVVGPDGVARAIRVAN
jgi:hypothetical protein